MSGRSACLQSKDEVCGGRIQKNRTQVNETLSAEYIYLFTIFFCNERALAKKGQYVYNECFSFPSGKFAYAKFFFFSIYVCCDERRTVDDDDKREKSKSTFFYTKSSLMWSCTTEQLCGHIF